MLGRTAGGIVDDDDRTRSRRGEHELPGHDERFLVRERESLPCSQCRERRFEACRADHCIDHNVGIRMCRCFDECFAAGAETRVRRRIRIIYEYSELRRECRDLFTQCDGITMRRERYDVKPITVSLEHTQRAVTDGSGRAEDRDADRHVAPGQPIRST